MPGTVRSPSTLVADIVADRPGPDARRPAGSGTFLSARGRPAPSGGTADPRRRDEVGVLAADADHITPSVSDDQDRTILREVLGALEQADAGLQLRAAAAA